jgi:hypothetical protein
LPSSVGAVGLEHGTHADTWVVGGGPYQQTAAVCHVPQSLGSAQVPGTEGDEIGLKLAEQPARSSRLGCCRHLGEEAFDPPSLGWVEHGHRTAAVFDEVVCLGHRGEVKLSYLVAEMIGVEACLCLLACPVQVSEVTVTLVRIGEVNVALVEHEAHDVLTSAILAEGVIVLGAEDDAVALRCSRFAVAAPGCLDDGVKGGKSSQNEWEVDIDPGLDDLGSDQMAGLPGG